MAEIISIYTRINGNRKVQSVEPKDLKRLTKKFTPLRERIPNVEVLGKERVGAVCEEIRRSYPTISESTAYQAAKMLDV